MHFISTRGNKEKVIASKAIIKGICDDGGLYVPTYFPNLKDKLNNLVNLSYKELCFEVLKLFLDDFNEKELMDCINKAYDDKFDNEKIAPTIKIKDNYFISEASAIKQLQKAKVPILFIHGDKDKFVPFYMLDKLYNACSSKKDKLIIKDVGHAKSESLKSDLYWNKVEDFIKPYM